MLNLPNFLTLIRIVAIPFFLVLLSLGLYLEALIVFVLGGLTDALDGAIARMAQQETALGARLDPVADKLLVVTSFVMLGVIGAIPQWLVVLVVSRDLIILIGYAAIYLLVEERLEARPTVVGKATTVLELVTVAFVLAFLYDPAVRLPRLLGPLFLLTGTATVISGCQYIYRGLVWLQKKGPSPGRLAHIEKGK